MKLNKCSEATTDLSVLPQILGAEVKHIIYGQMFWQNYYQEAIDPQQVWCLLHKCYELFNNGLLNLG